MPVEEFRRLGAFIDAPASSVGASEASEEDLHFLFKTFLYLFRAKRDDATRHSIRAIACGRANPVHSQLRATFTKLEEATFGDFEEHFKLDHDIFNCCKQLYQLQCCNSVI